MLCSVLRGEVQSLEIKKRAGDTVLTSKPFAFVINASHRYISRCYRFTYCNSKSISFFKTHTKA